MIIGRLHVRLGLFAMAAAAPGIAANCETGVVRFADPGSGRQLAVALLRNAAQSNLDLAAAFNILGIIYRKSERLQNAESAAVQAVRIYERSLTANGASLLEAAHNRRLDDHAHILRKLNRREEGKVLAARAASIQQTRPGADYSSTIVDIDDLWQNR